MPLIPIGSGEHWNIGEKKDLRSRAETLDDAEKKLKAVLGDDWKIVLDVDSFGEHTAGSPYRSSCGRFLICSIVRDCVDYDVKALEPAEVTFINANAKSHVFKFRCGPASDKYSVNERVEFAIGADGVDCKCNGKFFSYSFF